MHSDKKEFAEVLCASRRFIVVSEDLLNSFQATSSTKTLSVVAGDRVQLTKESSPPLVKSILPRTNILCRTYREEIREIVANLDLLLIMTAVGPLFNTNFIDRVLVATYEQDIPAILLVNKADLGLSECKSSIAAYQANKLETHPISAKFEIGLPGLLDSIKLRFPNKIAIVGMSGVGKSTLINKLIPEAERQTQEVSTRTGQGKQTTTQAIGFFHEVSPGMTGILFDLPGIQNFGLSHLDKAIVKEAFPEFADFQAECRYSDCAHIGENECGIKKALQAGLLAEFRYNSYLDIVAEIEAARPY